VFVPNGDSLSHARSSPHPRGMSRMKSLSMMVISDQADSSLIDQPIIGNRGPSLEVNESGRAISSDGFLTIDYPEKAD
jgi:hypothetical protein